MDRNKAVAAHTGEGGHNGSSHDSREHSHAPQTGKDRALDARQSAGRAAESHRLESGFNTGGRCSSGDAAARMSARLPLRGG